MLAAAAEAAAAAAVAAAGIPVDATCAAAGTLFFVVHLSKQRLYVSHC